VPPLTKTFWLRALAAFAFWTLLGVAFGVQFHFASEQIGNPVPWTRAFVYSLSDWYTFALLSIPAVWLASHLPIERRRRFRTVAIHLLASIVFSIAYVVLRSALAVLESPGSVSFEAARRTLFIKSWHFNLLVYWVIGAITHSFSYYRELRARELRTAELERHLTTARLQALQMQLNPHFLFNTLHAISSLMHQDVEAADRMLVRLSELLRRALDNSGTQEVTLREELEFLGSYAEIEQTRFGDRLKIEMNIAPETLDAFVPNLVLQPLVENAIKHGIEPSARESLIHVSSERHDRTLSLVVRDNGRGTKNDAVQDGVGLANTRARLQQLYGSAQTFHAANADGGGFEVNVTIPFRTA
jgi:two-component system, LytTR family, sensor kinase